ncbi:MAG: putative maltokinase [Candidatus Acidiferrales bacterium]
MILQQFDAQFLGRLRTAFAAQVPEYLPKQRWFGSKAKRIQSVRLSDCVPAPLPQSLALIALAVVEFVEGPVETYVLPLVAPPPDGPSSGDSTVVRVPISDHASEQPLNDALRDHEFLTAILVAIVDSKSIAGERGILRGTPEASLNQKTAASLATLRPRLLKGEQSNSSVVYGDQFILKFYRRLEEGVHPDLEIGRFLTSVAHFPNVPPHCGSLNYVSHEHTSMTLGLLQGFVPNQGDAWRHTVEHLVELFASPDHPTEEQEPGSIRRFASKVKSDLLISGAPEHQSAQMELIGLLGKRTAELHLALGSSSVDPEFTPEPFTPEFREEVHSAFHDLAVRNFAALRLKLPELPERVAELASQVLKLEDDALLILHSILERNISSIRIRIHGDYHLGQVLFTGSDYVIIDFEGEPARPLSARRTKRSPLQDVAGMLRSFHYAARSASLAANERLAKSHGYGMPSQEQIDTLAMRWQALATREFLRSYRSTAGDARFLPSSAADFDALLKVHLLEKAIYELGYELNNRPAWLAIPLAGIRETLRTSA